MNSKYAHYSILVQWSNEDQVYIASVAEFSICRTHGRTYEEAVQQAEEVIELWIEANEEWNRPVPAPKVLVSL